MKITKETRRKIAKIAKSLPYMQNTAKQIRRVVRGSTLIENRILSGRDGIEIQSNKTYLSGEFSDSVNHRKNLEKAFIGHGENGIIAYLNAVKTVMSKAIA